MGPLDGLKEGLQMLFVLAVLFGVLVGGCGVALVTCDGCPQVRLEWKDGAR